MWPTFQAGSFSKKVQQDAREDRRAGKALWRAASAAWERRRAGDARVAVQTVSLLSTRAAGSIAQAVSSPANQRLKLTGAAILVFRASTSLQAAPAA